MFDGDRRLNNFEEETLRVISGDRLMARVEEIAGYHRVRGMLARFRIPSRIIRAPIDGVRRYGSYLSPPGYRVRGAELGVRSAGGREVPIIDFHRNPMALCDYSGATPAGYQRYRPRWLETDDGQPLTRRDVLIASGPNESLQRQAFAHGDAAGFIRWQRFDDHRMRFARQWQRIGVLGTGRFLMDDTAPFGWNLSEKEADVIREICREDQGLGRETEIVCRVEASFGEGELPIVEADLRCGLPDAPLLLLTAHLCHPKPSAHDNASGCAAAIEAFEAMVELNRRADGRALCMDVRLLLLPEIIGSAAYLARHPDVAERAVGLINLDMVGGGPDLGEHVVYRSPTFSPTPLNQLLARQMARGARQLEEGRFTWREEPFAPGSDHELFVHPDYGVPAVAVIQWDDPYYHTDFDRPENLDDGVLRMAAWAAASTALMFAACDSRFRNLAFLRALDRTLLSFRRERQPAERRTGDARRLLADLRAAPAAWGSLRADIAERIEQLHDAVGAPSPPAPGDVKYANLIPLRRFRGALSRRIGWEMSGGKRMTPAEKFREDRNLDDMTRIAYAEMLIDGERSIADIVAEVSRHYGPLDADLLTDHIESLLPYGLLELIERSRR